MTNGQSAAFIFEPSHHELNNPLTKREYFAVTIFAGLLANPNWNQSIQEPEDYAKAAPIYADALIEALNK